MTHVINCPVCQHAMKEVKREGVMIDICLRCRGFWLDHGELEKIMSSGSATANTCLIQEKPKKGGRHALRGNRDYFFDDDDDTRSERGYVPQERKGRGSSRKTEQKTARSLFAFLF